MFPPYFISVFLFSVQRRLKIGISMNINWREMLPDINSLASCPKASDTHTHIGRGTLSIHCKPKAIHTKQVASSFICVVTHA